jgi:membrane-associated protein
VEFLQQLIALTTSLIDVVLHIDVHLNNLVVQLGPWLYAVVFAIVFCETGLVVTPILPGDSLLFALGAIAAIDGSPLSVGWLAALLIVAAVLGDAVNYKIGRHLGPRVFRSETSRLLNKKHLLATQGFYEKHGGKTIILARFAPIIRTFAPFVAGIGRMRYRDFAVFNVAGGVAWVCAFLFAGYFLGNVPAVKTNFHIIIVAIVVSSVMPGVIEFWRARRAAKAERSAARA